MTDRSRVRGVVRTADLPAVLNELVPETGDLLARTVADVFRSVPWTGAGQYAGDADLRGYGLTAVDAAIGAQAVHDCCAPYPLVYTCLHDLLRESRQRSPAARVALLRDCAILIEDGLTQDFNSIAEPLQMLLDEDLADEFLAELMDCTGFGERFAVGTASDEHHSWRVVRSVPEGPVSRGGTHGGGLIRVADWWDVPSWFLDRVPESAGYFAAQFADAIRDGADGIAQGPGPVPAQVLNEAILGR